MTTATDQFAADPFAPSSGQFALAGTTFVERWADEPSEAGVRPWGLRRAEPVTGTRNKLPRWSFDDRTQLAVDADGRPLIELPIAGPPTADTTSSTDGEDPPSSEDWKND